MCVYVCVGVCGCLRVMSGMNVRTYPALVYPRICVCVRERKRERERECVCEKEREFVRVSHVMSKPIDVTHVNASKNMCVCVCVCVCT